MVNEMRRNFLAERARSAEKNTVAYNILHNQITGNPVYGKYNTPEEIVELYGKMKPQEQEGFTKLLSDRKAF